jgi:DNA invertase Pin-like site-specific DNA recombinase
MPPSGSGQAGIGSHLRCGSYARFSSDSQRDTSIDDQQRLCRDAAIGNGHSVQKALEFEDRAVSGTKLHREGLDRLLAVAEARQIDVLYFHSLSRLARESVITMPVLKKLVYVDHVRVISVSEGIDSARTEWDVLATIFSLQHERYIRELSANIFRGQEGAVLSGYSVGDHCFGYRSEPVPGTEQGRRGRNVKPRMRYVIDPETAPWVQRVFKWFVIEKRSAGWIARELTRQAAPKDHRSTTRHWTPQLVTKLLRNRKFVGIWPWGLKNNFRNPLTGHVHQDDRLPEETEKWLRRLPDLLIIDGTIFAAAQVRLDEYRRRLEGRRKPNGQLGGSVSGDAETSPRHLLANLLRCTECKQLFHVGGSNGKYLNCSTYRNGGSCTCKTMVLRTVAENVILREIGRQILADTAWREAVYAAAIVAHAKAESELPSAIKNTISAIAEIDRKMERLVDQVEAGAAAPEVDARLNKRRGERQELEQKLARLQTQDDRRMPEPTREWIDQQFRQLESVLTSCGPAAALALRALVGGVVWVREIELPHSDRRRLQARFTVRMTTAARAMAGLSGMNDQQPGELFAQTERKSEVVVELREPDVVEQIAEEVRALWETGLTIKEIARRVGRNRNLVKDALLLAYTRCGLPVPDTQDRKRTLRKPLLAETLMERIMELWHQGMPHGKIAAECNCDNSIVTSAVKRWHEQRSLPVPDGRTRRKLLREQASEAEVNASLGIQLKTSHHQKSEHTNIADSNGADQSEEDMTPESAA